MSDESKEAMALIVFVLLIIFIVACLIWFDQFLSNYFFITKIKCISNELGVLLNA
jgi:hypothetical protein